MQINDIFNLNQYGEAYNFVNQNQGLTIIEIEPRLEEVIKTRQVEKIDKEGNTYFEEETYTTQELVKYYQLVELPKPSLEELKEAKRAEINSANLAANRALISNGSGKVAVSAVTSTELGYLDGVTSAIQTQLNNLNNKFNNSNYSMVPNFSSVTRWGNQQYTVPSTVGYLF